MFERLENRHQVAGRGAHLVDGADDVVEIHAGVDLNDIVRAVNQVGAAPGDLVAILEALKQSGALRAELIVI